MKPPPGCLLLCLLGLAALPLRAFAAERVCLDNSKDRDYAMRWMTGVKAEVKGLEFYGRQVYWESNGNWRTEGVYQRSAGYDSTGVHRIFLNETRYEYNAGQGEGGALHVHITRRLTHPEDEARVRERRYDYPLPDETPAREPIQTTGFNKGVTYTRYAAACSVPEPGLILPSDLSFWDIAVLYFLMALEKDKE